MSLNKFNKNNSKVDYLNKDFESFRKNLIDYTKVHFPKTYSDFNESSPGMLFIEMASYLGDVLSYYVDDTLKESLMVYAEDKQNVLALSQYLGYKPKVTSPAVTKIAVYQVVPSKTDPDDSTKRIPDEDYLLRIEEGMVLESSQNAVRFRTTDTVDFTSEYEREMTVYDRDADGVNFYLAKKYVDAISGTEKTLTKTFTSLQEFSRIDISDKNVIEIIDIRDSDGNKWYEVPYLAQDTVFVDYPNVESFDQDLSQFKDSVPTVLKLLKTSRRFTTQVNDDNTTSIIFGGGTETTSDESLIPTLKNVGLGLESSINRLYSGFDPSNFLKSRTYGQAPPVGKEFTVTYLVGGGVSSNVPKGDITRIQSIEFNEELSYFTDSELPQYRRIKASVAVENEIPARGGRGAESIEEIRQNALANFGSQNRAVTRKDYQVRALSLPPKYGGITKAYCAPDGELENNSPSSLLANPESLNEFSEIVQSFIATSKNQQVDERQIREELRNFLVGKKSQTDEKNNPFAINLYLLGYDNDKKLSRLNRAVKENLKTYLNEYRMLTDGVNVIDGFIINIGVNFSIRTYNNYNKREVLVNCITELRDYFNIDKWTFNMPINLSEVEVLIAGVEGVQSVSELEIVNKCKGAYSNNSYNIKEAIKDKLIYPSLDPSIFELKFPNKDIVGRVI